jgi:hypothetical protein
MLQANILEEVPAMLVLVLASTYQDQEEDQLERKEDLLEWLLAY